MSNICRFLQNMIQDDGPDFGVSAHLAKSSDQYYTGFIVISTDEYSTAKEAIDDIVWFAKTYDLGFDASDIDLGSILHERQDNA